MIASSNSLFMEPLRTLGWLKTKVAAQQVAKAVLGNLVMSLSRCVCVVAGDDSYLVFWKLCTLPQGSSWGAGPNSRHLDNSHADSLTWKWNMARWMTTFRSKQGISTLIRRVHVGHDSKVHNS